MESAVDRIPLHRRLDGVEVLAPEATQHGRDEQARKGTITRRQLRHAGVIFNRLIERMSLPQDSADQVERCASGSDRVNYSTDSRKTLHLRKLARMWQSFNSP